MILWNGHASFRITGGAKRIVIDPYHVKKDSLPADYLLITHHHMRHCSYEDIERTAGSSTIFFAPPKAAAALERYAQRLHVMEHGRSYADDDVRIEAVRAYSPRNEGAHPQEDGGVGYIVTAAGKRIYHAGDTGFIPEMDDIRCDIALLPVSGGNVMTALEAAEVAEKLRPALAIPMHYGTVEGSIADAYHFCSAALAKGVSVKILSLP